MKPIDSILEKQFSSVSVVERSRRQSVLDECVSPPGQPNHSDMLPREVFITRWKADRVLKLRAPEVRVAEVCAAEVRAPKVRVAEVCAPESHVAGGLRR